MRIKICTRDDGEDEDEGPEEEEENKKTLWKMIRVVLFVTFFVV